jgi:hypothetical protein
MVTVLEPIDHNENFIMRARNRVGTEQGCRTDPPGYTTWRNWFLGIDSWAP